VATGRAACVEPDGVIDVEHETGEPTGAALEAQTRKQVELALHKHGVDTGCGRERARHARPARAQSAHLPDKATGAESTLLARVEQWAERNSDAVRSQCMCRDTGADTERRR
jgi:hypothetical protein